MPDRRQCKMGLAGESLSQTEKPVAVSCFIATQTIQRTAWLTRRSKRKGPVMSDEITPDEDSTIDKLRKGKPIVPRPALIGKCPNDPNGHHNWQHVGNFVQPITNAPMSNFTCSRCSANTIAPLGQVPPHETRLASVA